MAVHGNNHMSHSSPLARVSPTQSLSEKSRESQHIDSAARPSITAPAQGRRKSSNVLKLERDVFDHPSNVDFSHINEKAILRKMDLRLIPMLALLYLLSFLDRGNIGNAKIQGLAEDLHMTGPQYNWTLTVFFFTYCAFEVPSNLLLKRLRPSIWLPSIMVAWGTVMTLMGLVKNFHGLLIARLFLGVAEAGLYPGVAYYITLWYCRHEAQTRQALFFSAASIAGAFSGLLAYAIANMNGVAGLRGWQWIFILEGIATVVVAIIAYFTIYDFPETAQFLSPEERAFVVHRLKYQGSAGTHNATHKVAEAEDFQWKYVFAAFKDWQIYASLFMYWGIVCPLYGISLFLPSIIKELGYQAEQAQLMTVPIYITAAILSVALAIWSDRKGTRSPFILLSMMFILVGFIIAISAASHGHMPRVVYAGVFIATIGIYPAFPGNVTWLSNNLAGSYKRSAGMAMQIGIGNLGGAMASNFYRSKDAPKYVLGHALELGFIVAGIIAVLLMRLNYTRINKQRDAMEDSHADESTYDEKHYSELGDRAPTFRYAL